MEKIKNPIVLEGLTLLFSYIFGLMIDETIQKSIIESPDSYKWYSLILDVLHVDKVITPVLVFLWVLGTLSYIFYKIKDERF